jgi:hypothetical protein
MSCGRQAAGFLTPVGLSHLAGDRHHDLPGERRAARARPTVSRTFSMMVVGLGGGEGVVALLFYFVVKPTGTF